MTNIAECCIKLNKLRMQGGRYNTMELIKALKGIPYAGYLPTVIRANAGIPGINVLRVGFEFDPCKPIYKDTLVYLIEEAKKMCDECNNKTHLKHDFKKLLGKPLPTTAIRLKNMVIERCIELYWEGKCKEATKLNIAYEEYVKIC